MCHFKRWLPRLADDIYYLVPGLRFNLPAIGTFGGHIIYLDLGEQERMGEQGNVLGTFHSYMAAYTVSFGKKISSLSSIGFNVKHIIQKLSEFGAGAEEVTDISKDFAFDLGYYRRQLLFSRLDFGLAVSNMGPKIASIDEEQAGPAPTNMKLGIKWSMIETRYNRLALLYDMNKLLVASYPSIDYDGDGSIGGFDADGNPSSGGEYGENGRWEQAHTDPWYLALFTSWFDDWLYGGDIDRNGNMVIESSEEFEDLNDNGKWDTNEPYTDSNGNQSYDRGEVNNRYEATFRDELDTITHNIGIEYWLTSHFALRSGFIYDKLGKIGNPTFGAGIHFGGFRADIGYIYGTEYSLTNTKCLSLNWAF